MNQIKVHVFTMRRMLRSHVQSVHTVHQFKLKYITGSEELGCKVKSDQTHSGNNISSKHSAILQTYQRLFSCEWRATEKPKYSLSPGPLNTTADPISTLKPQIPIDWSKQTKAASSLYIFGLDAEGRSSLELYYCVAILNPLDLKPSTHLTSLPDIKSDKSWCQISINPWKIGGGDDLWCRIRFNPLRWMTELSRSFPLSYLRFKSTNVLEARNWKVFLLFRRAPRGTEKRKQIFRWMKFSMTFKFLCTQGYSVSRFRERSLEATNLFSATEYKSLPKKDKNKHSPSSTADWKLKLEVSGLPYLSYTVVDSENSATKTNELCCFQGCAT